MILAELLRRASERLAPVSPTARIDAEVLVAHALGLDRAGLIAATNREPDEVANGASLHRAPRLGPIGDDTRRRIESLLARRERGEPVAYITGRREFWSLPLAVTPAVLIPRPETELLVERALARIPATTGVTVADLGTGSGAVALAIARERPRSTIVACDASPEALEIARRNAAALGIGHIEFRMGDWLAPLAGETANAPALKAGRASAASRATESARGPRTRVPGVPPITSPIGETANAPSLARGPRLDPIGETFDVIVSNPPYIPADDPHLLEGDVRFEPRAALVSGADGLDAIRAIVRGARAHLKPGGWLLLEHGHDQAAAIEDLLNKSGFRETRSYHDIAGHPRVIEARHGLRVAHRRAICF